jgi:ribose transport system substrate-binding protein
MIDGMIQEGVKQLILAPVPVTNAPTPVKLPFPVIFVDRDSSDFTAVSTVSTDNHAAGQVAARSLQGVLPKGAKIAVLRLAQQAPAPTAREKGFIEAAKAMGYDIVVDTYIGYGIREAQGKAAEALAAYPGRIDAAFASNESATFGALMAIEQLPADKQPKLVGFDYRSEFADALRKGKLHAIMVQDPFQMGYRAVEQFVNARKGQPIAPRTIVDVLVVTGNNIDSADTQKALSQFAD